jgi:type IV secretion/conjugal transfer VirB4 family ATPase
MDYNPRQRNITSENAADWTSMDSVGQGLTSCSWGKNITDFKTVTGGVYSFVFHVSAEKTALGNTIVIGGSSSGKTTLISFLISQCFKYPNFRALLFDRLHGLEVFTRFHDGSYIDFSEGVEVNPLQLDDNSLNRTFLSQFFQMLMPSFTSPENLKLIDDAIRQIMTLPKADRNIENISDAFGLGGEGTIRSALGRWLSEGSNGGYFSGVKDALELSALTTFDMTYLLESPDILGPMTYYIFHRLFQSARGDGGYIVFLDEMANYLKSSVFSPKIEMLLQEIRKTDGVFIGAVQDAGTLLDHEIAPKIQNNTGTYILFPEPRAQERHYIAGLGLNAREFAWIREDHPRHALVKRKSGESVMLNVDISSLGKYLDIFSSDASAVKKLNDCRKAEKDWKSEYLAG